MAKKTSGQLEIERRRKKREIVISDLSVCYFCKSTGLAEADKFCPNCAFPQRGTQMQMQRFVWAFRNKESLLKDQKKAVGKARIMLFILAGVTFTYGLAFLLEPAALAIQVILALAYLGLAFWCAKKPFPAILSAFFIFLVVQIMLAIQDPATIAHGFLGKIIIISALIYGYRGALQSDKLEKELVSLKRAENFNPPDELS